MKRGCAIRLPNVTIVGIEKTKDTPTTLRYRISYLAADGTEEHRLKVEISYRQAFDEKDDVLTIDGIRFASLPRIIDQKLLAAFDGKDRRTASRDLFDLDFLATKYPRAFTHDLARRLVAFTDDPTTLYSEYEQAFEEEDLGLSVAEVEELVYGFMKTAARFCAKSRND